MTIGFLLTDHDSTNWTLLRNTTNPQRGELRTADCTIEVRIEGGQWVIAGKPVATNPGDPFGAADVAAILQNATTWLADNGAALLPR
jgi:hypothetical protein